MPHAIRTRGVSAGEAAFAACVRPHRSLTSLLHIVARGSPQPTSHAWQSDRWTAGITQDGKHD